MNKKRKPLVIKGFFPLAFLLALIACGEKLTDQEYVQRAISQIENNRPNAAIIELKNALSKNPNNVNARHLLGTIYLEQGNFKGAEKELTLALDAESGDNNPKIMLDLSRTLLKSGKYVALFEQLSPDSFIDDSDKSSAIAILGSAYLANNDLTKAEALLSQSQEIKDNSEARAGLIRLAITENNAEKATRLISDALAAYPEDFSLKVLASEFYEQQQDPETALAYLNEALELNTSTFLLLRKANLLIAIDNRPEAQKIVSSVLQKNPDILFAKYLQASLFASEGKHKESQNHLEQILASAPKHPESLLLLGTLYFNAGEYQRAQSFLNTYEDVAPDSSKARFMQAFIYTQNNDLAAAEIALRDYLSDYPNNTNALNLLGNTLIREGNIDGGLETLKKAQSIDSESYQNNLMLAITLLGSGKASEAIPHFLKLYQSGENLPTVRPLLIRSYIETKDYEQAISLAEKISKESSTKTEGYNYLGYIYLAKGDKPNAIKSFKSAISTEPANPVANIHLAQIAIDAADFDQAQAYYNSVYSQNPDQFQTLIANAALDVQRGDIQSAIARYERATKTNKTDLNSRLALSSYYLKYGQYLDAVKLLGSVEHLYQDNPVYLNYFIQALLKQRLNQKALHVIEQLKTIAPDQITTYLLEARANIQTGDFVKASQVFAEANRVQKDNLLIIYESAKLAIAKSDLPEAQKILDRMAVLNAPNNLLFLLEGDIAFAKNDYLNAITYYKESLSVSANSETLIKLINSAYKAGNTDQAISLSEDWLKQFPSSDDIRSFLAKILIKTGQIDQAIEHLTYQVNQDPDDVAALNNLAWVMKESAPKNALEYSKKAYALAPKNPNVLDTYAVILLSLGDAGKAATLLQQASSISPNNPEISLHLAKALFANDSKYKAKEVLEKIVKNYPESTEYADAKSLLEKL